MAARLGPTERSERAREDYERAQAKRIEAERALAERRKVLAKTMREEEARVRREQMQTVLDVERQTGARLLDAANTDQSVRAWLRNAFPGDTHDSVFAVLDLGREERAKRRDPRPGKRPVSIPSATGEE